MTAPDYAMENLDKCTKPVLLGMYCWIIWLNEAAQHTVFDWIPPGTRKRLERDSDYEVTP